MANTRRENRLEELGRVDAEKAYTSKGKRNLREEKHRIRKELKKGGRAKPWGHGPKPGSLEFFQHHTQSPKRKCKAKEESTGYEPYAKQIAQFYQGHINVLEEVINILFYIAESDGEVSSSELTMIENISKIFGLTQVQFNSIRESRKGSDKLNPYIVLESNPDDDLQSIRKKYLKLSKENHPDLLISKGVPQEIIDESKNKMRAINSAWDQIQKLKSN